MNSLRKVKVGIPSLAGLVLLFAALWHLSLLLGTQAGKGFVSNLSLFWVAVFSLCPYICGGFLLLLTAIYFRGHRAHTKWYATAVVIGLTPMLWFVAWWIRG